MIEKQIRELCKRSIKQAAVDSRLRLEMMKALKAGPIMGDPEPPPPPPDPETDCEALQDLLQAVQDEIAFQGC